MNPSLYFFLFLPFFLLWNVESLVVCYLVVLGGCIFFFLIHWGGGLNPRPPFWKLGCYVAICFWCSVDVLADINGDQNIFEQKFIQILLWFSPFSSTIF